MLKVSQLVGGEIYSSFNTDKKSEHNPYIFQCRESGKAKYSHRIVDERYSENEEFGETIASHLKLATDDEKQWLRVCIEVGKFIPKEEALKHYCNYQIY
jgi:hypothetical protein